MLLSILLLSTVVFDVEYQVMPPTVAVTGQATTESAPELATIAFDVRGEGGTSNDAAQALVDIENRIMSALAARSQELEIKDDDFRIVAIHSQDCENPASEMMFDDAAVSYLEGDCAITGYVARKSIIVRTPSVDDAGTLAGLASREGGLNAEVSSFSLKDNSTAKNEAIALALADARSKAEAIAAGSGATLGDVVSVELDRAGSAGQDIIITANRLTAAAPPTTVVEIGLLPAPIKTSAQVKVVYSLGQ